MAVKKSGLGRGLDALFPEKSVPSKSGAKDTKEKTAVHPVKTSEKKEEKTAGGPVIVKISKVEPNREQPRKKFDEDALLELSESIKQYGILQPLLVSDKKSYFEIIAGERRWRAAKMAGLKEVPVVIKEFSFKFLRKSSVSVFAVSSSAASPPFSSSVRSASILLN